VKDRKLSTIELTVLGFAWLRGPCTTYAIMKELSHSESTYHKSRAGTAYSVSRRLIEHGFLEHVDSAEGGTEVLVQISEKGRAELQDWMKPPLPLGDIAHSADLIRLRFFFLGVVDQQQRLDFIDNSIEGLQVFLKRCEALIPANEELGDYFGALATVSSILESRARIEWLKIVRHWVENPMSENENWSDTILEQLKK